MATAYLSSILISPGEDSTTSFTVVTLNLRAHKILDLPTAHVVRPPSAGLSILKIDTIFFQESLPLLVVIWDGSD